MPSYVLACHTNSREFRDGARDYAVYAVLLIRSGYIIQRVIIAHKYADNFTQITLIVHECVSRASRIRGEFQRDSNNAEKKKRKKKQTNSAEQKTIKKVGKFKS